MIYIGNAENNGSAIYFDIHSAERQGRGMRFSGTVGDGCYEGEVLVEIGRTDSVTFADAWLGGTGFTEFVDRCGMTMLERALLETVREMPFSRARPSQPHGYSSAPDSSQVADAFSSWRSGSC